MAFLLSYYSSLFLGTEAMAFWTLSKFRIGRYIVETSMEFFEIQKKKSLKATRPSFQKKAATTTFIREKTSTMSMPSRHEKVEEKGKEEAFARLKRLSRKILLAPYYY